MQLGLGLSLTLLLPAASAVQPAEPATDALLLDDGTSFLVLDDGSKILIRP